MLFQVLIQKKKELKKKKLLQKMRFNLFIGVNTSVNS